MLKLTIKTPERSHWPELERYFTTFPSVSTAGLEQLNVSWVRWMRTQYLLLVQASDC